MKIKETSIVTLIIVTVVTVFMACNGKKKETVDASENLNITYFKNIQSNINGYQIKGFNPLPIEIVKKTDCFKITKDEAGKVVEVAFVIKNRTENSYLYGFATKKMTYTDSTIQTRIFDKYGKQMAYGKPAQDKTLFVKEVMLKNGIPFGERGLDIFGNSIAGFSEKRFESNKGNQIEWEWSVDNAGASLDYANGAGVYFKKYQYNDSGWLLSTGFYSSKTQRAALGGIHAVQYEYNENGNIIKNSFVDAALKLRSDPSSGMAYRIMEYNEYGNMLKQTLCDVQGKPVVNNSGYAIQVSTFDQYTNNILSTYFDEENKPVLNKELGAHGEHFVYDKAGEMVLKEFVNEQQKLVFSAHDGYAYQAMEYNDSGWLISEAYFDASNKALEPVWFKAHTKQNTYYDNGMLKMTSYFDKNTKPIVLETCACTSVLFKYDSIGNVIEETYLNLEGKPTEKGKGGMASRKFKYDVFGEILLMEIYDAKGNEITLEGNRGIQ